MAQPKSKPQQPTRAHRVLWDRDLPFRARTERNRVAYQRRSKHRARDSQAESMT
jgi:hypothetical protein